MSDQSTSFTPPLRTANGRRTQADSPFGYIGAAASSAIAQGVKNQTKLALYAFLANRPENGVAEVSDVWYENTGEKDDQGRNIFKAVYPEIDADLSAEDSRNKYLAWQEKMEERAKNGEVMKGKPAVHTDAVFISESQKKAHIITLKIGGEDKMIFLNGNPRAAQAINGELNVEQEDEYRQFFGPVLRFLSGVNTSWSPEFWISNIQRDTMFALISTLVDKDLSYTRDFAKNLKKALSVVDFVRKNDRDMLGDSYLERMYREFADNGGITGYTVVNDNEVWENELKKFTAKQLDSVNAVRKALNGIQLFGEGIEQITRFAAFLTAREKGKSVQEAVAEAKELTVNFNRKGSGKPISLDEAKKLRTPSGKPLSKAQQYFVVVASQMPRFGRKYILFFNASVQGLNRMYELSKNNPRRMATAITTAIMLGILTAIYHAMTDDDDYLDMPDYERRTNLLIGKDGYYFRWAMPQEMRVFYGVGDVLANHLMGRSPHKNMLKEATELVADILPLSSTDNLAKALVPAAAMPLFENWINENFLGSRIYNDFKYMSEDEKEKIPQYQKALNGTARIYVDASKFLNEISGGNYMERGALDILNPGKVEHLVEGYTGGLGTTIEKAVQTGSALMGGEPLMVRNIPFLRRLFTVSGERYRNSYINDLYYYYKGEAEHTDKLLKQYKKDGQDDLYNSLNSSREKIILDIYKMFKKDIDSYNDKIKIETDPTELRRLMAEQDSVKNEMLRLISIN